MEDHNEVARCYSRNHHLFRERISLTLAVSDLLKTQKQETQLDVSGIRQRVTNRRDAQIVYAGLTYHYGRPAKQDKKDCLLYTSPSPRDRTRSRMPSSA